AQLRAHACRRRAPAGGSAVAAAHRSHDDRSGTGRRAGADHTPLNSRRAVALGAIQCIGAAPAKPCFSATNRLWPASRATGSRFLQAQTTCRHPHTYGNTAMHLKELKKRAPADLVEMAEEYGVEGASTMRRQDLMFAILKEVAEDGEEIIGQGTIEVLQDGFGFLRSPEANYLAGPDDIYVSPNQVRKWGLRTGDTVEGEIRAPKDGERYFALTKPIT